MVQEKTIQRVKAGLKEAGITLMLVAFVLVGMRSWQSKELLDSSGGLSAPEIQLIAVDGSKTQLSALQGKPVLVHFWATW